MMENLYNAIEKGALDLEDYSLDNFVVYLRDMSKNAWDEKPDLAVLLESLAKETASKQEKKRRFERTPEVLAMAIVKEERRIKEINNHLIKNYPEEYIKLKRQMELFLQAN